MVLDDEWCGGFMRRICKQIWPNGKRRIILVHIYKFCQQYRCVHAELVAVHVAKQLDVPVYNDV